MVPDLFPARDMLLKLPQEFRSFDAVKNSLLRDTPNCPKVLPLQHCVVISDDVAVRENSEENSAFYHFALLEFVKAWLISLGLAYELKQVDLRRHNFSPFFVKFKLTLLHDVHILGIGPFLVDCLFVHVTSLLKEQVKVNHLLSAPAVENGHIHQKRGDSRL